MHPIRTAAARLVHVVVIALGLSACGGPPPSNMPPPTAVRVDLPRATDMAENLLGGYNDGAYAAYTRDFDDAMKAAVTVEKFNAGRAQLLAAYGRFLRITDANAESGKTPGYVNYVFACEFEKAKVDLRIGLPVDGERIAGVRFEPRN